MDLAATLPASSAIAEQGFSIMKKAKTDWRSRLQSNKMTEILRIKLHAPNVQEYDPTSAIHLWNLSSVRGRRFNQEPYGTRENTDSSESEYDSEFEIEFEPEDK